MFAARNLANAVLIVRITIFGDLDIRKNGVCSILIRTYVRRRQGFMTESRSQGKDNRRRAQKQMNLFHKCLNLGVNDLLFFTGFRSIPLHQLSDGSSLSLLGWFYR